VLLLTKGVDRTVIELGTLPLQKKKKGKPGINLKKGVHIFTLKQNAADKATGDVIHSRYK
jgi:hypothetical protein